MNDLFAHRIRRDHAVNPNNEFFIISILVHPRSPVRSSKQRMITGCPVWRPFISVLRTSVAGNAGETAKRNILATSAKRVVGVELLEHSKNVILSKRFPVSPRLCGGIGFAEKKATLFQSYDDT